MKLWLRSYAPAALMGTRDTTMNPSPAASSILRAHLGSRRFGVVVERVKRRRRSFHPGNPIPAAIAIGSSLIGGSLGKRLESRGAKDARHKAKVDQLAELAKQGSADALTALQNAGGATAERRAYTAAKILEVTTALSVERRAAGAAAARERGAVGARREALLAGVAGDVGKVLLSRGRSLRQPARRPRRRSTYSY